MVFQHQRGLYGVGGKGTGFFTGPSYFLSDKTKAIATHGRGGTRPYPTVAGCWRGTAWRVGWRGEAFCRRVIYRQVQLLPPTLEVLQRKINVGP